MMKKDLAKALGISASMVSRLAKQGMPTDSVFAAQRWREQNLEFARSKGVRLFSEPPPDVARPLATNPRLTALRALVRASNTDLFLPLDDWLALVDYCISHRARQHLQALGTGAAMVTASGLARLIYGGEAAGDGRMWFNLAGDVFDMADTLHPEVSDPEASE